METTINKNKTAEVKTRTGNNYSYQYVDIAQIHEYLENNNMSYYQYIDRIDNDDYIMTIKIIDGKESAPLRGARVVDATLFGTDNPAQKQGSALTYARRYSLLMAFGLATEDNDAQDLTIEKIERKEDAENYTLNFGKHSGKTLKEILEIDQKYINWLFENEKTDKTIKHCITLMTGRIDQTEEQIEESIKKINELNNLLDKTGTDREKFYDYYGVKNNAELSIEQLDDAIKKLKERIDKK